MSCSPSPRQTKSTSGHCVLTSCAFSVAKTPPNASLTFGVGRAELARENLRVGIAGRRQEAHADEVGLLPPHLLDDDLVRRVRIGLVEHHDLVPGALEDRGERHDADRRKTHDLKAAVRGRVLPRDRVELRVANVDEEDSHEL